jgi:hypothetical protein
LFVSRGCYVSDWFCFSRILVEIVCLCVGWHVPCRITTCWVWLLESPSPLICATIVCSLVVVSYVANVSLRLSLLIWTATGLLGLILSLALCCCSCSWFC